MQDAGLGAAEAQLGGPWQLGGRLLAATLLDPPLLPHLQPRGPSCTCNSRPGHGRPLFSVPGVHEGAHAPHVEALSKSFLVYKQIPFKPGTAGSAYSLVMSQAALPTAGLHPHGADGEGLARGPWVSDSLYVDGYEAGALLRAPQTVRSGSLYCKMHAQLVIAHSSSCILIVVCRTWCAVACVVWCLQVYKEGFSHYFCRPGG